jgi:uncharacterized protein YkwD
MFRTTLQRVGRSARAVLLATLVPGAVLGQSLLAGSAAPSALDPAAPAFQDEDEEFEEDEYDDSDEDEVDLSDRFPGTPKERLSRAYEELFELLGSRGFEVKPRAGQVTADLLEAHHGPAIPMVLREKAGLLDARLVAERERVRSLLPCATDGVRRSTIFEEEDALDSLRRDALALIEIYERNRQKEVDVNRAGVEKAYERYSGLVEHEFDFAKSAEFDAETAWNTLVFLRRGEELLDLVDACLDDRGEVAADRTESDEDTSPTAALYAERGTYFTGAPAGLEDFAYLLLLHAADQPVEVLARTDLLTRRIDVEPTRFERWLLRELRARAVTRFNERAVHSGTDEDAAFTLIINAYRRGLGLELLTVDERLLLASRQHSQHQVDNDYFSHDCPDPRKATPWDRAALEHFTGNVAENLATGRGGYAAKSVFEAWYRSPGHHRNMVGPRHRHLGAARDTGGSMWTLLLGEGDPTWRDWHPDVAPARRAENAKTLDRSAKALAGGKLKDKAWKNDVQPLLTDFVDVLFGPTFVECSEPDDGAWKDSIDAFDRLLAAKLDLLALEETAVMHVIDHAADSEDTGLRRAADGFLRAHVPGLVPELDAIDAREGDWEAVRIAWEDRERVQFQAARSSS